MRSGKNDDHKMLTMRDRKVDGDHWQWKETARWVKFEEDVEEVTAASFFLHVHTFFSSQKVKFE